MALVEVGRFYAVIEAEIARTVLEQAGIDSVIFDGQMNAYIGGVSPVRLMVLDDELGAARATLADHI